MKNLREKVWMILAVMVLFVTMTPAARAASADDVPGEETSFWEDVKTAGANLYQSAKENAPGWWQSAKDAASDAVDTVKEHGPEWVESAKDKGSELVGKGKDALQNAGDKVSGFLDDQQNQFWERTEQQISGGTPSESPATAPSESPAATPSESVAPSLAPDAGDSAANSESPTPEGGSTPGSSVPAEGDTSGSSAPVEGVTPDSSPAEGQENDYGSNSIVPDEGNPAATEQPSLPDKSAIYAFIAVALGLVAVGCGSYLLGKSRRG